MNFILKEFKDWRKQEGLPWNPNFVPRTFDGLPDLEHEYWKAEQAALEFEKARDAKATPALPAPAPRKKAAPRPAIIETKDHLEIFNREATGADLMRVLDMSQEAFDAVASDLKALKKRVEELEAAPSVPPVEYKGVWRQGEYRKGNMVSWSGSIWHCNRTTEDKPASSDAWTLCCKKGRDGKDAK
jgi:hypothetical protein